MGSLWYMTEDWGHPTLACTGVRAWNVVILVEIISDSFTWIGFDEVPPEFGGVGKM